MFNFIFKDDPFTVWLKKILSNDKSASFGRLGAATVIYFLCLWSTWIVVKTTSIPLGAPFWFGLVTFLYLGGKGIEAYSNKQEVKNVEPVGSNGALPEN